MGDLQALLVVAGEANRVFVMLIDWRLKISTCVKAKARRDERRETRDNRRLVTLDISGSRHENIV